MLGTSNKMILQKLINTLKYILNFILIFPMYYQKFELHHKIYKYKYLFNIKDNNSKIASLSIKPLANRAT